MTMHVRNVFTYTYLSHLNHNYTCFKSACDQKRGVQMQARQSVYTLIEEIYITWIRILGMGEKSIGSKWCM